MRNIPEIPKDLKAGSDAANLKGSRPAIDFEVELLTPLVGGGVEKGKPDPVCWLRASEVKYELRFWWRAAFAHRFDSTKDLWQAESALFGAAARYEKRKSRPQLVSGPGLLSVETIEILRLAPKSLADLGIRQGDPQYVLYFSKPEKTLPPGCKARVLIRLLPRNGWCPPVESFSRPRKESVPVADQVLKAIQLWLVLGGVGSRTRRGAGALGFVQAEKAGELGVPQDVSGLEKLLQSFVSEPGAKIEGLPILQAVRSCWLNAERDPLDSLLRALRDTRQKGRRALSGGHYTKNEWPESDSIRNLYPPTQQWAHHWGFTGFEFPRLILGAPIVMQFKKPREPGRREPLPHTLSLRWRDKNMSRFASPLFLRPVRVWERGTPKHVAAAVLFEPPLPNGTQGRIERPGGGSVPYDPPFDVKAGGAVILGEMEKQLAKCGFRRITI